MADLDTQFHDAAERVQSLDERPDNDTLLQLYALYKQSTEGDVSGKRPGFTKLAARIWLPEDAEDNPVPAILEYLPYRKRDGTVERDHLTHP